MSPFLPRRYAKPQTVSHGDWQDDVDRTLLKLEPWVVAGEHRAGAPYFFVAPTAPGPLAALYDALVAFGAERGWRVGMSGALR